MVIQKLFYTMYTVRTVWKYPTVPTPELLFYFTAIENSQTTSYNGPPKNTDPKSLVVGKGTFFIYLSTSALLTHSSTFINPLAPESNAHSNCNLKGGCKWADVII
jgi:hypothetical protein